MITKRVLVLLVAGATMTAAVAQAPKPERQIKLRQAGFTLIGYGFGNLAAMADGKIPFSKDDAARLGDLLREVAPVPKAFFGEGTDKGETNAKPEIWSKRADFDAKMDKMLGEMGKLTAATRTGDLTAIKAAVATTGDACKACHDEYRVKH